jgi:2-oxoglutarate dehydrogenase E1 component
MSYTYQISSLSEAFDHYLKNKSCQDKELDAFFDGFLLGKQSLEGQDPVESMAAFLIQMYRHFGHLQAKTNPLKDQEPSKYLQIRPPFSKTSPLNKKYFDKTFETLGDLEAFLQTIYTGSIGYQYLHTEHQVIQTLQQAIETPQENDLIFNELNLYEMIAEAEGFETFLHTRFPGQKRFSLEGLESGLPLVMQIIAQAKNLGFDGAFLGMAHRGRLNFLANLFKKPLSLIFNEFSKEYVPSDLKGLGDVKYHMGAYHTMADGFELFLSSNPSHLEAVDPVIQGMSYQYLKEYKKKPITLMIHGDASFAGQGVVYESLQIGQVPGFCAKGSIHIIFNNQIGFTALPKESRSTPSCSDLAKAFNIPVFQVNSQDLMAIQKVGSLAMKLVHEYGLDVMIELIGFRKWGHNESDEPSFTQPLLYQKIKSQKNILSIFRESLISQNPLIEKDLSLIDEKIKENLQKAFGEKAPLNPLMFKEKQPLKETVSSDIQKLGEAIFTLPANFHAHPKLIKLFEERKKICNKKELIDYPTAELLALAYAIDQKGSIRFVGQDSQRGTFSQRHAVLVDQVNESRYTIFESINKEKRPCEFINSPLSEYAVLGFEYGFSKGACHQINIWEAQFGDFVNGAQIIIDQFIASGKTKWDESSNLVLLLPHGYEGQGPEHTSARIERFLELCAEDNMRVCIPSSPSQIYHLLKQQLYSKKPLIIFSPKALLRHPECKDPFEKIENGTFEPIIDDKQMNATVCVLTYGKIYFDLLAKKKEKNLNHISIVRLDQLYPLNHHDLETLISSKNGIKKLVLIQDEPINMGAYYYLKARMKNLEVIARKEASSPASGFYCIHDKEQNELLNQFENL